MSRIQKILLAILVVFVAIQFIQPSKNISSEILPTDITRVFTVPQKVQDLLKTSCYDCHSNNTRYPWYSFIQPGAWWMDHHIKEGKQNLNFSEFGSYSNRKQQNKFRSTAKSILDETMPIKPYLIIHADSKFTEDQKIFVLDWINKTKDSMEARR
ncbi:hypothetical protein BH09BAC2_BH09BAC2_15470 [soil metagenome]